jgi:hypothetical protein
MFRVLIAAGLGAGLAYLFDPQMGNGRRARLRDQALSKLRGGAEDAQGFGQDLGNRAYGMAHEATDAVRSSVPTGTSG